VVIDARSKVMTDEEIHGVRNREIFERTEGWISRHITDETELAKVISRKTTMKLWFNNEGRELFRGRRQANWGALSRWNKRRKQLKWVAGDKGKGCYAQR
jgi:hypothetical protein